MSIFSNRIGKPRLAEGMLLYLVCVALIAAATIVLFSVASISLLGNSKETLIDNSSNEEKFIGTVVSYLDRNTARVPFQTKSPSSNEANDRTPQQQLRNPLACSARKP